MKKTLSLSAMFVLLIVSACSTTPGGDTTTPSGGTSTNTTTTPTTVQDVLKSLNGTWEEGPTDLVFSGDTVKINNDTLTLDNPNSVVLENTIYAVYKGTLSTDGPTVAIFRTEGSDLFGDFGDTLEDLKTKFTRDPRSFKTPAGSRGKSTKGREIAKTLSGTWNGDVVGRLTFFGRSISMGATTFILAPSDSVTIDGKDFAVYVPSGGGKLRIFRTEGNNLFSDTGDTLADIQQGFNRDPSTLQNHIAVRIMN